MKPYVGQSVVIDGAAAIVTEVGKETFHATVFPPQTGIHNTTVAIDDESWKPVTAPVEEKETATV